MDLNRKRGQKRVKPRKDIQGSLIVDVDGDGDAFGAGLEPGEGGLLVGDEEGNVVGGAESQRHHQQRQEAADQRLGDRIRHFRGPVLSLSLFWIRKVSFGLGLTMIFIYWGLQQIAALSVLFLLFFFFFFFFLFVFFFFFFPFKLKAWKKLLLGLVLVISHPICLSLSLSLFKTFISI